MHTVILIANPAEAALGGALCASLRNAWGGGDVVWLAPDEAAEFSIAEVPGNHRDVWEECQKLGVDMVVLPSQGRRKRMLLADMDSTMIRQECIDELADMAGVGDRVAAITRRAMNGELAFEEALRERVALLRGLPSSVIAQVLKERIAFTPGGKALVATMRAEGAFTMLVSGGFVEFAAEVATSLGFDDFRANGLLTAEGRLTGGVAEPILGRDAKVAALKEACGRLGIAPAEVLAVGDGANDLDMLNAAGLGVALHAKPSVQAACDVRINFGDLTALLYLQGYSRDQFVV